MNPTDEPTDPTHPTHPTERTDEPAAHAQRELDARGQRCPLPVINLARLVRDSPEVRRVTVLATDPAAAHDIPAWCRMRGHTFVATRDEGGHTAYVVDIVRPSTAEEEREGRSGATPGSRPVGPP